MLLFVLHAVFSYCKDACGSTGDPVELSRHSECVSLPDDSVLPPNRTRERCAVPLCTAAQAGELFLHPRQNLSDSGIVGPGLPDSAAW